MRRFLYTLCLLSLGGCISLLTRPNSLECEAGSPSRCEGNTLIVCVDGVELQQDCGEDTCDAASGACAQVAPGCGNGITEAGLGEECDDGNAQSGDGCDQNCQIEVVAECGDGLVQAGEQCDDGNLLNTDTCTNACVNARCGDGFIRTGVETCDDGNTTNNDGCSSSCQIENNNCGNGTVNAGEECDDGNQSNTDACTNECQAAVCGDGFVRTGVEQCDDGNQNNNDACRNNCTLQTCGNGVVNAGEECDDGNQVAGDFTSDFCDPNCRNPGCGNGFVGNFQFFPGFPFPEGCDDGNLVSGDGCDSQCLVESNPVCGNGVVEAGEGCDDGDTQSGDGCSSTCQVEGGNGTCQAPTIISLGSTSGSTTGQQNNLTGSCTGGQAPEVVFRFTPASSGTLTITLQSATDQGFYVRTNCQNSAELICQDAVVGGTNEVGQLSVTGGVPLFIIVDGFASGTSGPFTLTLSLGGGGAVCGNGIVEAGEQCDDGDTTSGDGCSSTCTVESGNGTCASPFTALSSNTGNTATPANISDGSCQTSVQGGGLGGDVVFRLVAANSGTVTFTLVSANDHGVFVQSSCGNINTELGCADIAFPGNPLNPDTETLSLNVTAGQTLFIFVGAFAPTTEGSFTLTIQ